MKFFYIRINSQLIITCQIPLTTFRNPFQVYQIETYPMNIPSETQHVMRLNQQEQVIGIAVEVGAKYFYTLTESCLK